MTITPNTTPRDIPSISVDVACIVIASALAIVAKCRPKIRVEFSSVDSCPHSNALLDSETIEFWTRITSSKFGRVILMFNLLTP